MSQVHERVSESQTGFTEIGERYLELSTKVKQMEADYLQFGVKITTYVSDSKTQLKMEMAQLAGLMDQVSRGQTHLLNQINLE
jgi:hypothetical protein